MGLIFDTVTYDLLFVTFSLLVYAYFQLKKRLNYFAENGVPHLKCTGFLEYNQLGLFRNKCAAEEYEQLYKSFEGHPYCGYYTFFTPQLMIREPATIEKITRTYFSHFNGHGVPADPERNFLDRHLFVISGREWKALRNRLVPAFTSGKMRGMAPLITECTRNYMKFLATSTDEVKNNNTKFTLDVIGNVAFGVQSQSLQDNDSEFKQVAAKAFKITVIRAIKLILAFLSPRIPRLLGFQTQDPEVAEFFKKLLKDTIEHREANNETRNDFVDILRQLKAKGKVDMEPQDKDEIEEENAVMDSDNIKLEITDQLLTAQAFVFFIAGHETTSSTLSFLMYLLAKHPEIQEKARKEVRAKKQEFGEINFECVKSMRYVEACINEGLRLFPPISLLPRICTKEFCMDDGFVVRTGTRVIIPIFAIHRDPKYHPEPEKYNPERFINGTIQPGTFLPFGDGPRACIGKRFALLELILATSSLLDNYEILPNPKMVEPIVLKSKFITYESKNGIWVTLKKLEDAPEA